MVAMERLIGPTTDLALGYCFGRKSEKRKSSPISVDSCPMGFALCVVRLLFVLVWYTRLECTRKKVSILGLSTAVCFQMEKSFAFGPNVVGAYACLLGFDCNCLLRCHYVPAHPRQQRALFQHDLFLSAASSVVFFSLFDFCHHRFAPR